MSDTLFKHLYLRSSIGYAVVSIDNGTVLMANPAFAGCLDIQRMNLRVCVIWILPVRRMSIPWITA